MDVDPISAHFLNKQIPVENFSQTNPSSSLNNCLVFVVHWSEANHIFYMITIPLKANSMLFKNILLCTISRKKKRLINSTANSLTWISDGYKGNTTCTCVYMYDGRVGRFRI